MKKSHVWDIYETIAVQCPYCRENFEEEHCCIIEGDIIDCQYCGKEFELGEQK